MMTFHVRTSSPLMKVGGRRMSVHSGISAHSFWCVISFSCVFPDMIYEDVQRESGPLGADNGWSSSEFESYDEQSDNETKPPTRSKVALACTHARLMCVFIPGESSTLFILKGIVSGQVALLSNT